MIINEFFAIRFPTNKGPDMYGLATQIHRNYCVELKNGRALHVQSLKIMSCFNPNGLVTKAELESFYSDEDINKDDSHIVFDKKCDFYKNNKSRFTPMELIVLIRKALSNPLDFENICGEKIVIFLNTIINKQRHVAELTHKQDIPYHLYVLREFDKEVFDEIQFEGHFPWEKQRKDAERDFFVIKMLDERHQIKYVAGKKKSGFGLAYNTFWAKQFLSENETFRYIEKYLDAFGKTGYEIEEIKGMTMEDGLDI